MRRSLFLLTALLVVWYVVARLAWISELYLPDPFKVARSFRIKLLAATAVTCSRMFAGVAIGSVAAHVFHFAAFRFGVTRSLDRQLAGSRSVPVIAMLPLFVMWFGFSEFGRILVISLSAMLFVIGPLQTAFSSLPRRWTILREQHSISPLLYYCSVVVPGTLPTMLGAYRLTVATAFTMAIASEYMGADRGIGKFIDSARVTFNVPAMFLAIFLAASVGLLVDQFTVGVYRRFVHWTDYGEKS